MHKTYIHTSLVFRFDRSVACFHGRAHNMEPDFFYVRYLSFVSHDSPDSLVAKILIPVFHLIGSFSNDDGNGKENVTSK